MASRWSFWSAAWPLDAESEAVLAYTKAIDIDEHGRQLKKQVRQRRVFKPARGAPRYEPTGAQLRIHFRIDAGKRFEACPGI